MKKTLFAVCLLSLGCLLSTATAFAQYTSAGYRSSELTVYDVPSHPQHAGYAPLQQEQSVIASTSYNSAQGDRRPSDFPQAEGIALGTAARELKKQRDGAKRTAIVWVN